MLAELGYHREHAVEYAIKWAQKRNPNYLNFDGIGGDCTNFASQCLLAGCNVMNDTPTFGWYYDTANNRTPSWTGVQYLYDFLIQNESSGPYAKECSRQQLEIGDLIQLGNEQHQFYHTLVVTELISNEIYISAHTFDALNRSLDSYSYNQIRFLHIIGARAYL